MFIFLCEECVNILATTSYFIATTPIFILYMEETMLEIVAGQSISP